MAETELAEFGIAHGLLRSRVRVTPGGLLAVSAIVLASLLGSALIVRAAGRAR